MNKHTKQLFQHTIEYLEAKEKEFKDKGIEPTIQNVVNDLKIYITRNE